MSDKAKVNRFYSVGENKGYSRRDMFNEILSIAQGDGTYKGEEIDLERLVAAANYELMLMDNKRKNTGEAKDPLESDYAKAIMKDVIPFVERKAKTVSQLVNEVTAAGVKSPKGGAYATAWVARVLSHLVNTSDRIVKEVVIVDKVDKDGLKGQVKATGYRLS